MAVVLVGLFCLVVLAPTVASATPLDRTNLGKPETIVPEISLGDSTFRLTTDRPAIPLDGGYSYVVEITPGADLVSVNLRFQLMREENGWAFHYFGDSVTIDRPAAHEAADTATAAGTTVTNGTNGASTAEGAGSAAATASGQPELIRHLLQRRSGDNLDGLGMREGVYYVAVIVTANTTSGSESATLQDLLVVYDPESPVLNILPTFQLAALPARDAHGVFLTGSDEGNFESSRASLEAVCSWIKQNQRARLSLALPAFFIEDLDAASQDADPERAQAGEETLTALRDALATGRLTLSSQGYADPNLSILSALGRTEDLPQHFEQGRRVLSDYLGVEPARVTIPWTSQLTADDMDALLQIIPGQATHPTRIIVDDQSAGLAPQHTGEARSALLAQDRSAEIMIASTSLSTAVSSDSSRAAFLLHLLDARQESAVEPLIVRTADPEATALYLGNLDLFTRYGWINIMGAEAPLDLTPARLDFASPDLAPRLPDSVLELASSRTAIEGLSYALTDELAAEDAEYVQYDTASLAAFAGAGVQISQIGITLSASSAAPACLALAREVSSYVDARFSDLHISASPITFAGSRGVLPITVINGSGQPFYLDVRYVSQGHNVILYPEYTHQQFLSGESFLEPSVELRNIVSGSIDIQLWAANHLIAEESVRVSATYADRIAIIVLVVLAGTGLAFYVWKRSGSANDENPDDSPSNDDDYLDDEQRLQELIRDLKEEST